MPVETRTIRQAYKYALDLTPTLQRHFNQHAGAARFVFNWGLSTVAAHLDAHAAGQATGGYPQHFELCQMWTAHKNTRRTPDEDGRTLEWVDNISVATQQAALRDAAQAWRNFFDSRKGNRAGRRIGRPRYKSRHRSQRAFQLHGDGLGVPDAHHLRLPKIGVVKTHESTRKLLRRLRQTHPPQETYGADVRIGQEVACHDGHLVPDLSTLEGLDPAAVQWLPVVAVKPKRKKGAPPAAPTPGVKLVSPGASVRSTPLVPFPATPAVTRWRKARLVRASVSQHSDGRWYASLTVELPREVRTGPSARQRAGGTVGIDIGVREAVTLSTGVRYTAPAFLNSALGDLAHAQRVLSRRQQGSKRRERAKRRVGRLHARVGFLRRDWSHKLSSNLIHNHARIGVEGFNLAALAEHGSADIPKQLRKRRNRALADAGLGTLRWQLQSKAAWYGCEVVVTDPHQETGRTCSVCATVRAKPVPPHINEFYCQNCGHRTDRRLNTAQVLALTVSRRHETGAPSSEEPLNGRGGDVRPEAPPGVDGFP